MSAATARVVFGMRESGAMSDAEFEHPFLFLRHGETDWNREGRTQGQIDTALNALGRAQAVEAAERLRAEPIARIVASPLSRARDTAEIVAQAVDAPLAFDDDLKEAMMGEMEGAPHDERNPAYWRGEHAPADGETFQRFGDRVWAAMRRAVALGPDTLIIAHGGLWIAAKARVAVAPSFAMPNAAPIRVTPGSDGWRAEPLIDLARRDLPSGEGAHDR